MPIVNPSIETEFYPTGSFPVTGVTGVLYVDTTLAATYIWNGSNYIQTRSTISYRVNAAQATTLNTYGNITQLVTGSLPVGNYSFRAQIRAQSAAANTGYGFRLGLGSATVNNLSGSWFLPTGTDLAAAHFTGYTQRTATDNLVTSSVGAANTDYMVVAHGFFTVTAQGTVAIQFRSETNGTAITVGIGSNLIIERLP